MSNFVRLHDREEAFNFFLQQRLQAPEALPWANVIKPEYVTSNDAYTQIVDESEGVLKAVSKHGAVKTMDLPQARYREQKAVQVGGRVVFSEKDIADQSGNLLLENSTINLKKSKGETEQQLADRAMKHLTDLAMNQLLNMAGGWLTGSFVVEGDNGGSVTFNTAITDGAALGTLWDTNPTTVTPLDDMIAIDTVLRSLTGNRGRSIKYGNTIMSNQIKKFLFKTEQMLKFNTGSGFQSIAPLETLNQLREFNEYFGVIIDHELGYPEAGAMVYPTTLNHITVFSGTQLQPAGKLLIMPGDLSEHFNGMQSGNQKGFAMFYNKILPNSLNDYIVHEFVLKAWVIPVEYFGGYTVQVIS